MRTYKDLLVWQKSIELVKEIYKLTRQFPKEEGYGLVSQLRRASVSIASNIAEGRMRSEGDFRKFLFYSYGSGAEVETQIFIAKQIKETSNLDYSNADKLLQEVMKILNRLIKNRCY